MDTKLFLETLFGDKPHDSYVTIFTLPNQKSKFFQDVNEAATYVQRINNQSQHIYFATNLQGEVKLQGRGKANDSIGTVCFYTDVDMECTSAHTKCDLPRDEQEAYSILKGFGWDPSLVVHSGYGLHVYWIFKEPWIFTDDHERERFHEILIRLQATIRERSHQKGWSLDYTNDLARVLRVADTWNIKVKDNPIKVRVIESSGLRYNPEDIEPFLIDKAHIAKSKSLPSEIKAQIAKGLVYDASAEAPQKKLEQLLEVNEIFKSTWNGTRHEFGNDPSRFAQSLANFAARVNWTDQEMCNLLIHWYRKHLNNTTFLNRKDPISMEKIMRPVKVATTIGKAKQAAAEAAAKEYIEDIAPAEDSGMGEIVDPDGKKAFKFLEGSIRLKVISLKKYIPEEGNEYFYEMKIDHNNSERSVTFAKAEALFNQTTFRYRVSGAINRMPVAVDKDTWQRVTEAFDKIMEQIEVVSEKVTIDGKMRSWMCQYLDKRSPIDIVRGHAAGNPFVHKGHWYIFAKPFADWTLSQQGNVAGAAAIEVSLKRVNATNERVDYKSPSDPKKRVQFRVWKIPHEIITPPPTLIVDNTKTEPDEEDEQDAKVQP